jgi:hypothetical protein
MDTYKHKCVCDWLLGNTDKFPNYGMSSYPKGLKVVNSPLSYYLGQVNRFLFSGGVTVNTESEAAKTFLSTFNNQNHFLRKLDQLWERVAVTGEILLLSYLNQDGSNFNLEIFEKDQYKIKGDLATIKVIVKIDNKDFIRKIKANKEAIYLYELVPLEKSNSVNWVKVPYTEVKAYGILPYTLVSAKVDLNTNRGITLFNDAIKTMALMQLTLSLDLCENVHFFGQPWIASTDPEDVLRRLQERKQVFPKDSDETGNSVDILSPPTLDRNAIDWVESFDDKILLALGINTRKKASDVSENVSSLTLKLQYQETIDVAETVWSNLVDHGLVPFYENLLAIAKSAGIIPIVDNVEISRIKPYFYKTPLEISQELANMELLASHGANVLPLIKHIFNNSPIINEAFNDTLNGM